MTAAIEEKIRTMSGVSKRLFVALSDFRADPPQLEDALFQMASVVDATSKHYYPKEQTTKRYVKYLNSITTGLFKVATSGRITLVDCTFLASDGKQRSFGEILYKIRCSSYHDPNEVDGLVHWGETNEFGTKDGKFIVNDKILMALFLMLISDVANKNHIDLSLFTDEHFLTYEGVNHPFHRFVGKRDHLLDVLGLAC